MLLLGGGGGGAVVVVVVVVVVLASRVFVPVTSVLSFAGFPGLTFLPSILHTLDTILLSIKIYINGGKENI